MLGLSVGAGSPRSLRRPTKRLVQRIVLLSSQNETLASAEGHGPLTLHIAAPALHAGEYRVDSATLENGPVCLVLPEVSLTSEGAVAKPGLWACDPQLGPVELTGQWVFEANPDLVILGLSLTLAENLAGRTTRYGETARQAGNAIAATSALLTLPEMPVQEPEPDLPPQDPEPEQPSPPEPAPVDPLPPIGDPAPEEPKLKVIYADDGTFQLGVDPTKPLSLTINPPHPHAGSYDIYPSDYASGPINHVKPIVAGQPAMGATYTATIGFWTHDADAAPLVINRRWQRDGVDIPDATSTSYTTTAEDGGKNVRWAETLSDTNGSRSVYSDALQFVAGALQPDVLTTTSGTASINNVTLQSGETWTNLRGGFIRNTRNMISSSSGSVARRGVENRSPVQRVFTTLIRAGTANFGGGPAVRIQENGSNYHLIPNSGGRFILRRFLVNGDGTTSTQTIHDVTNPASDFTATNDIAVAELFINSSNEISFRVGNSAWFGPFAVPSDNILTGGGVGIFGGSTALSTSATWPTTFDARTF